MDDNSEAERVFNEIIQVNVPKITLTNTPVKLVDVLEQIAPQGQRVKKGEFVGEQITIVSLRPFIGQFGPAIFVIFYDSNGELFNTIISNRVLMPKLLLIIEHLPVTTTIIKKGSGSGEYYDFE